MVREFFKESGLDEEMLEGICFLVGHHHTFTDIDGQDYQILLEADFLVNCFAHGNPRESLLHTLNIVYATKAGKAIFAEMFGL